MEILISGLTLYPGDDVSFDCSGWDPRMGRSQWTMQVLAGDQPIVEEHGRQASFMWRVTEANIAGSAFVQVSLISNRPWHRETDSDGRRMFCYTVLPRG